MNLLEIKKQKKLKILVNILKKGVTFWIKNNRTYTNKKRFKKVPKYCF